MRVFIEDSFDAAHWLPNVPVSHKCHNLHGHTYHVRIELEGEVDAVTGWVIDYAVIKGGWDVIKKMVDHYSLNEIEGLENSTCEILAQWIWKRLLVFQWGDKLVRLEVRETEALRSCFGMIAMLDTSEDLSVCQTESDVLSNNFLHLSLALLLNGLRIISQ